MQQKNTIIWCMLTQIWSACTEKILCHFKPLFAFLPHYWPQKLKFGKNVKNHLDILSFYNCVPLIKIIWGMVPEIWSSKDKIFLSSWAFFFCFYPPNTLKSENIKNEKTTWRYHHFTQVYQKSWPSLKLFHRYGASWV